MTRGKRNNAKKVGFEPKTQTKNVDGKVVESDTKPEAAPAQQILQVQLLNLPQMVAAVRENSGANKSITVRYPKRIDDARVEILADDVPVAEADLYFAHDLLIDKETQCLMRPVYFMKLRKIADAPVITISLDAPDNVDASEEKPVRKPRTPSTMTLELNESVSK